MNNNATEALFGRQRNENDPPSPSLRRQADEFASALDLLAFPLCTFCKTPYMPRDATRAGKKPFVLQCGHSICEECVSERRERPFRCLACDAKHEPVELDLHFHLIGKTWCCGGLMAEKEQQQLATPEGHWLCVECETTYTKMVCVECDSYFCVDCFKRTHSSAKTFSAHKMMNRDLLLKRLMEDRNACKAHEKEKETFCLECGVTTCESCNREAHEGHQMVTIAEKNEEFLIELEERYKQVDAGKWLSDWALAKAIEMEKRQKAFGQETITEMTDYFAFLHGKMQIREAQLAEKVKSGYTSLMEKTKAIKEQIKNARTRFEEKQDQIRHFCENLPSHVYLGDLLNETIGILETTRCHIRFTGDYKNPFVLNKDPEKFDCDVNFDSKAFGHVNMTTFEFLAETTARKSTPEGEEPLPPQVLQEMLKVGEGIGRNPCRDDSAVFSKVDFRIPRCLPVKVEPEPSITSKCSSRFRAIIRRSEAAKVPKQEPNNNNVSSSYDIHDKLVKLNAEIDRNQAPKRPSIAPPGFVVSKTRKAEVRDDEPTFEMEGQLFQVTETPTPTAAWLPPLPVTDREFLATPLYVEADATIWLRHDGRKPLANRITEVINNCLRDMPPPTPETQLKVGQPCIAHFIYDKTFYRATVLKRDEACWYDVLFVDYGNADIVHISEIRTQIFAGNVPTLVNKFRLMGVLPPIDHDDWPSTTAAYLHHLIVGKQCQIEVFPDSTIDGVPGCKIILTETGQNVALHLVDKKLATVDEYDHHHKAALKPGPTPPPFPADIFLSLSDNDASKDVNPDNTHDFDLSEQNFLPTETSTRFSEPIASPRFSLLCKGFPSLLLEPGHHGSRVRLVEMLSPCVVQLDLLLATHHDVHAKLVRDIKTELSSTPVTLPPSLKPDDCVLARCRGDGEWYRGRIEAIHGDFATIRFVDIANTDCVRCDDLRYCPPNLRLVPMRYVRAQLAGLMPNHRLTEKEVMAAMRTAVGGRTLMLSIEECGPLPRVQLLENGTLAYQRLIEDGTYLCRSPSK